MNADGDGGGAMEFHPGAYKMVALGLYLCGAVWYINEGWKAYSAAADVARSYPFFLDMNPFSVTGFSFTGGLYWTTVGLDRSNSPKAVAGYLMAGIHVLVFAIQVWLGPMIWALNNLS